MCNGDLGMYRVMPWAYPTIPGQSSGGASVDPTPEPSVNVFDASDAVAKWTISTVTLEDYVPNVYSRAFPEVELSGVKVLDSSGVSKIEIWTKQQPNYSVSLTNPNLVIAVNLGLDPNGVLGPQLLASAGDSGKTVTITGGSVEIRAYSSDGEIMQSSEVMIT